MAHHVALVEAGDGDAGHAFHRLQRVAHAGAGAGGEIDLGEVAGDDHAGAFAHAGEEHLHLHRGGVLRFVENDEGMGQGAAAHEGERGDLDLPGAHAAGDLVAGHHVVQRVVERAQVGIDLFLEVAGQEAEAFAGFDGGAGEHDAVHLAGGEHGHGLGDGEVGLAGAGGAEGEDHFVAGQQVHVGGLARGARADGAALGADGRKIGQRQARVFDFGEADGGIDLAGADGLAALELGVEAVDGALGGFHAGGVASDGEAVAAAGEPHAQSLFHAHQVPVVVAQE